MQQADGWKNILVRHRRLGVLALVWLGAARDAIEQGMDVFGAAFPRRLGLDDLKRCSRRRGEAEYLAAALDEFCTKRTACDIAAQSLGVERLLQLIEPC